ncbi:MAG: hypothetical protein PF518_00215 [Spirochaetaceae bacterium]|jgi:hypothetical protein|nr:hypothetical protein [Spirochaetaceae bacterium]
MLTISVLIVILSIIIIGTIHFILYSRKIGVVPMPSSEKERMKVTEILNRYPELLRATDLGSGWGGLARKIRRQCPDLEIQAIEKSPIPYVISRLLSFITNSTSIIYRNCDIDDIPLRNYEAYITYLSGPAMKTLRTHFEKDHPRKGILISIAFAMPGWTPVYVEYIETMFHSPIYLYEY